MLIEYSILGVRYSYSVQRVLTKYSIHVRCSYSAQRVLKKYSFQVSCTHRMFKWALCDGVKTEYPHTHRVLNSNKWALCDGVKTEYPVLTGYSNWVPITWIEYFVSTLWTLHTNWVLWEHLLSTRRASHTKNWVLCDHSMNTSWAPLWVPYLLCAWVIH